MKKYTEELESLTAALLQSKETHETTQIPNRIHKQNVTKKNNPKQDNNIPRYYITNKTLTQEDKTIVGTKPHQPAKEDQMPRNKFLNKCNISRYYITNKTPTQEDKTIVGTKSTTPPKQHDRNHNKKSDQLQPPKQEDVENGQVHTHMHVLQKDLQLSSQIPDPYAQRTLHHHK